MADRIDSMMDKAQTLIEALPYIREFSNKTVVVKYGGSAMLDEELKKKVSQDIALLKLVGMHPVIVHGGGKEISKGQRCACGRHQRQGRQHAYGSQKDRGRAGYRLCRRG